MYDLLPLSPPEIIEKQDQYLEKIRGLVSQKYGVRLEVVLTDKSENSIQWYRNNCYDAYTAFEEIFGDPDDVLLMAEINGMSHMLELDDV